MVREEFKQEYDLGKLQTITPQKRDFKMHVAPRYVDHFCKNVYEDFTSDLLRNFSKDNMLFIDIGAHYGYYTILVGTKHPNCRIISFEPVPENFEILRRNVALNHLKNVDVHNLAISNQNGSSKFKVTTASDSCGFHGHPFAETIREIEVETVRLDNFLNEISQVPIIIKIDTEGHEIPVLDGMKDILVNSKDIRLIVEFNPKCLVNAGYDPTSILEKLSQLGFDIYFIADTQRITNKLDENALSRWQDYLPDEFNTRSYVNMLCVKKQKSLSVCFFSHSSQLAGAERSLLELTSELIRDHGVACTVILPSEGPLKGRLEEAGASTIVMNLPWWCDSGLPEENLMKAKFNSAFTGLLNDLKRYLEIINPDVVVTNTMVIPWGAIAASLLGKPHIWFIREFGQLDHGLKYYLLFQRTLDIIKDSSNLILTNSDAVKNTLFGNSSQNNIQTVYSHISIPNDKLDCGDTHYFKRPNAIKVAVLGHITESKGQEDSVLAVRELVRRNKDVELIIAGTANKAYLNKLEAVVREECLDAYLQFKDFTENPYPIIDQADIILICSRNEAFGRVTLEAMLLKKPVIGTNSGGTPELIKEGFNGFLYEPGDYKQLANKIEYLVENKDKMTELGSNGYRFAQEGFTKEKFGGRVYQLLLNLKGTPNPLASAYSNLITGLMLDTLSDLQEKTKSKDAKIAENKVAFQQKEAEILSLQSSLKQEETEISTLQSSLQQKEAEITSLQSSLQQIDAQIPDLQMKSAYLQTQIDSMTSSLSLRAAKKSENIVNKLLPYGTRRRLFVKLIVKVALHPIKFINKLTPRNIGRFFLHLITKGPTKVGQMVDRKLQQP